MHDFAMRAMNGRIRIGARPGGFMSIKFRIRTTWHRRCLFILSLLALPCHLSAKDLGMFYGEPTPALAMYVAQVNFAVDKCVSEELIQDTKGAERLLKHFNNGVQLREYKEKDEDFAANLAYYSENYNSAWNRSTQEQNQKFCDGLRTDLETKEQSFLRWAVAIDYFRARLSPISEESANRKRKIAGVLSVLGAAATTAASISAGTDSVSSAKAGDWATSNQQMAASRSFNQAGAAIVGAAPPATTPADSPLFSVLEENGEVVRCPVIDHFFGYSAPSDNTIWSTYQSVSMKCRDLLPTDAARIRR